MKNRYTLPLGLAAVLLLAASRIEVGLPLEKTFGAVTAIDTGPRTYTGQAEGPSARPDALYRWRGYSIGRASSVGTGAALSDARDRCRMPIARASRPHGTGAAVLRASAGTAGGEAIRGLRGFHRPPVVKQSQPQRSQRRRAKASHSAQASIRKR